VVGCSVMWCDGMRSGVVRCGGAWCGVMCGEVRCGGAWCGVVWCGVRSMVERCCGEMYAGNKPKDKVLKR